ncbi:hypothetical protein BGX21_004802 [Mortierella sp. AD011]|nr:hypothetical protein BGX21_004802 [Mortierella sp. AD011]
MALNPEPFCAGESVCVIITGILSAPITAPSLVTVFGEYFSITEYSQSFDLCSLVPCPVAQNTTTLEFCFPVPSVVFPFALDFTISSSNGNGNILFCQAGNATPSYCSS